MAGPTKRRALTNDSNNDSNDESDSESYQGGEEIQADFEGRNPEGQDFHGIKQLLQQLFLRAHIDLSQLSDMIIAQHGVGSVIKQSMNDDEESEDDDMSDALDVFGITTVINITSHSATPCIIELINIIKELGQKHADKATQEEINKTLDGSNKLGLLLNERFVNIPAKISDPLFTSLISELERMFKKDPSYKFDYYIMICKLHKPKGNKGADVVFSNGEEELFAKEATFGFEFDVTNESDTSVSGKWKEGDIEMIPYRKVLFIKGDKLVNIVQQLKTFVN